MTAPWGKDRVSIGSAADNDVVLADPSVAKHHACLVRQSGQLFFLDLKTGGQLDRGQVPGGVEDSEGLFQSQ